jgi:hypothetical protein
LLRASRYQVSTMPKPPDETKASKAEDGPQRAQKTPPRPFLPKAKGKPNPGGPATKAEHAALKRADKTVIKRMRKR